MNTRQQTIQSLHFNPSIPVFILDDGVNSIGLFRELALQGVRCRVVAKRQGSVDRRVLRRAEMQCLQGRREGC